MDKEQFQQLFVISFLANRAAQVARHSGRRDKESMHEEALRYADVCWIHFCQIWPVKEHDPFWHNKVMKKIRDNAPPGDEKAD